jgi:hypothetical protein
VAVVECLKQKYVFFAPVITNDDLFGAERPTLPPRAVAADDFEGVSLDKPSVLLFK